MVQIRDFENYFFCPRTAGVYRKKSRGYVLLRPTKRNTSETTFILHRDGIPYAKKLQDILLENKEEIMGFLAKLRREKTLDA